MSPVTAWDIHRDVWEAIRLRHSFKEDVSRRSWADIVV